jgi:rhomboid protease GluP
MEPSQPPRDPTFAERVRAAPVTFALVAINVAVFLIDRALDGALIRRGQVDSVHVWAGEYWRLATHMVFHGGWVHLLMNCAMSIWLVSVVEAALGKRRFIFAYVVSGLAGGMACTVLLNGPTVGASGAIYGIVGALLALRWRQLRSIQAITSDRPTRSLLVQIAIWSVIGMSTNISNRAHFGGLITGGIVAWIMTAPRRRKEMWIAFTIVFLAALVFAVKPWLRGPAAAAVQEAATRQALRDQALLEPCDRGVRAACYAYELTLPDEVGDTTRDLEPACNQGEQDACGARGWALAHGRAGVVRDEARGNAMMNDACAKGSEWSCRLARGSPPSDIPAKK